MTPEAAHVATWAVALAATAGVLARPFGWPEAVWAAAGALVLLAAGLLSPQAALHAVGKGGDVYLFLTGMMLLSEVARREGLFDWAAAKAVNHARGSPGRLFLLVYAVGVLVTTFLSNDATAVVLTPAVFAAARAAGAEPLPYLFICALVANAASFVLPISNPANLVLYGSHMPPLAPWLASFAAPSAAAILVTYVVLRAAEGGGLGKACARDIPQPRLSAEGATALAGICATAVLLLVVSAFDRPLGLPTCILGAAAAAIVQIRKREPPWPVLQGVSWSVLPLVAGLFVLVEGLDRTGLTALLARTLAHGAEVSPTRTAAAGGAALAVLCNLMNNLPAGLLASATLAQAHPPQKVVDAFLIAVDLGPNLSITGSLATILWLTAIRREGERVGFRRFLRTGALAMPPALAVALAIRLALG
jgi:arsenical pump membrane protein